MCFAFGSCLVVGACLLVCLKIGCLGRWLGGGLLFVGFVVCYSLCDIVVRCVLFLVRCSLCVVRYVLFLVC